MILIQIKVFKQSEINNLIYQFNTRLNPAREKELANILCIYI